MRSGRALATGAVAVLVIGFGRGVVLPGDGNDTPAVSPASEAASAPPAAPPTTRGPAPGALGDRIQAGGLQLILRTVTDPFEGSDSVVTAPAAKRWVATDIEITNLSSTPATLAERDHFLLRDRADAQFGPTRTAEDLPALDGVLPPGETRRGTIVFELPEEARDLRLVFSAAPGNPAPIVVSLG